MVPAKPALAVFVQLRNHITLRALPQDILNGNAHPADGKVTAHPMILLTRLNKVPMVLNSDLIEHIEITPDTVITLTTGQKIMVLESAVEVVERVTAFRRSIYRGLLACPMSEPNDGGKNLTAREDVCKDG